MKIQRFLCTFHIHDWDRCKCRRCGSIRDQFHDTDKCMCKICGSEVHEFVEIGGDLHSCKCCGQTGKHEMEHFSMTREVPGMWSLDYPNFIQDVIGYKCKVCGYERIVYTGEPR